VIFTPQFCPISIKFGEHYPLHELNEYISIVTDTAQLFDE